MLGTSLGAGIPVIAGLAAGFVPEAGTFFISAGKRAGAAGEGAFVGAGFAVVIFCGCAGEAGFSSGLTAHGAAVHKSVTRIGFDFVFGLAVAV